MTNPVDILRWSTVGDGERQQLLSRPVTRTADDLRDKVSEIIAAVRSDGDPALRRLTKTFDKVELDSIIVTNEELADAAAQVNDAQMRAIDLAISNVRKFHEAQRPEQISVETMPGVLCERVSHPIDAVGLYVPAGTAPLPSAAIMLAVPAAIAECPVRLLCTPPTADGRADPYVLVAAMRAGVNNIYKLGGAQAIAALAFGTESVPPVDKIFGPGNAWVTEAKNQVASDPAGAAIDLPAGPSEVLVIADDSADAEFVAADLLSQAEHGADSQVLLVTDSIALAEAVAAAMQRQLKTLSRQAIAAAAIKNSRLIVTNDIAEAVALSNDYAPEHLILQLRDARTVLTGIRNAGSIFVGPWSPEAAGDYCSGTNHVLPTYGHARRYSGLGLDQFMRHMTVQELSREGLSSIAAAVIELANMEGLDAHAKSVSCRLAPDGSST